MGTSSEEYLAKRVQLAVALCGKVSSSYTMLFTHIGTMPFVWDRPKRKL
jgi:hypothetical protein